MAPPDGAAVSDDATGLTQRELLMEMREDIKGLKATVDVIAKDQALGVERRASMQRSADSIYARLDGHDRDPAASIAATASQSVASASIMPPPREGRASPRNPR